MERIDQTKSIIDLIIDNNLDHSKRVIANVLLTSDIQITEDDLINQPIAWLFKTVELFEETDGINGDVRDIILSGRDVNKSIHFNHHALLIAVARSISDARLVNSDTLTASDIDIGKLLHYYYILTMHPYASYEVMVERFDITSDDIEYLGYHSEGGINPTVCMWETAPIKEIINSTDYDDITDIIYTEVLDILTDGAYSEGA